MSEDRNYNDTMFAVVGAIAIVAFIATTCTAIREQAADAAFERRRDR